MPATQGGRCQPQAASSTNTAYRPTGSCSANGASTQSTHIYRIGPTTSSPLLPTRPTCRPACRTSCSHSAPTQPFSTTMHSPQAISRHQSSSGCTSSTPCGTRSSADSGCCSVSSPYTLRPGGDTKREARQGSLKLLEEGEGTRAVALWAHLIGGQHTCTADPSAQLRRREAGEMASWPSGCSGESSGDVAMQRIKSRQHIAGVGARE